MCIVRSLHTDAINHDPAHTFMNTGTMTAGRPAMGSWLLYGLGAETSSLPGFVVMVSTGRYGQRQPIAARQWHSGFLPGQFQGVEFRATGDPVLYVSNPKGVTTARQRDVVSAVQQLNQLGNARLDDPEIATRIAQYELAFRMQSSVPELMDVSREPKHVLDMYGTQGGDGSFASNCLLARRLAERGVRFIQLYHRDWDHHGAVKAHSAGTAAEVDQGAAALITDLKQRGMLDDTIVVFGSEFGRTPMAQGDGRDHHLAASRCGLPVAVSNPASAMGRLTNLVIEQLRTACQFTTCMRHCCINWASIIRDSRGSIRGLTPIDRRGGIAGGRGIAGLRLLDGGLPLYLTGKFKLRVCPAPPLPTFGDGAAMTSGSDVWKSGRSKDGLRSRSPGRSGV
jgi:hypothetical protein